MFKKILVLMLMSIFSLAVFAGVVLAETETIQVGDINEDGLPADWAGADQNAIRDAFIAEYDRQVASGFDMGLVYDAIQEWNQVVARQMFTGGDQSGSPWGWAQTGFIMLSAPAARAFTLKDAYLNAWSYNNHFDSVGFPVSNSFQYKDSGYQVFSKSTIKITGDEIEVLEHFPGRGDATYPETGDWNTEKAATLAAFRAEYDRLQKEGYNPGYPHDSVKLWDGTQVMAQTFVGGDNTADPFGWDLKLCYIIKGSPAQPAVVVKGDMLVAWMNASVGNAFTVAGVPLEPERTISGNLYQQFANGYIKLPGGQATDAVFVAGTIGEVEEPNPTTADPGMALALALAAIALVGTVPALRRAR